MAATPDRDPGVRFEEEIEFEIQSTLANIEQRMRYSMDRFSQADGFGEYDPRHATGQVLLYRFIPRDVLVQSIYTFLVHDIEIEDGNEILVLNGGEVLAI